MWPGQNTLAEGLDWDIANERRLLRKELQLQTIIWFNLSKGEGFRGDFKRIS